MPPNDALPVVHLSWPHLLYVALGALLWYGLYLILAAL